MSHRHLEKALSGCAVHKAEALVQDVEPEPPVVQRAAGKAVTASPRAQSAAKPTEKGSPPDASQRLKAPTSVGKATGWKTRSRPNIDLDGKKVLVDTPAANDSAVGGLAARAAGAIALAMMPPIPGPPLTEHTHPKGAANGDPSSSKHGKQKIGSDAVLAQAGGRSQKAGACPKGKTQPDEETSEKEGIIHWLRRPKCCASLHAQLVCRAAEFMKNNPCLVAVQVQLLAFCN